MLTVLGFGRSCRAGCSAATCGGEDGAKLGEVALQGVLRLLELVIRSARVLWKCSRGQLGTRVDGGERIGRAAQLTVDRLGRDSGELGPGLRGRELGKLPGCTAVLLRGSAGVERQRGGVSVAEQSLCAAEQREAAARVCGEAAG